MSITIHSVFHPNVRLDAKPTDLIFTSADHVQFHVQRDRVVTSSSNCFNLLLYLPVEGPVVLAEDSDLISTILHLIYEKPLNFQPSVATILASFDAFRKYGLPLKKYFTPPSQFFEATRAQILIQPKEFALEIYIRASQNDLFELAKAASPILLSFSLTMLDTVKLQQIHPIYLGKLYALHSERLKALQEILRTPPPNHPFTPTCGAQGQEVLLKSWNIQASQIIVESSATPSE